MVGIILAAGKGSRLSSLNIVHKSLIEIHKKRVIDFNLDMLVDSGKIDKIIIVVGHNADEVINSIGDNYRGVDILYVNQKERKGVAHAVKTAMDFIDDDFIMCLADEILINNRLNAMIDDFYLRDLYCSCGCVVNPNDFSGKPISYKLDNGHVVGVEEKTKNYENSFRGVGECIFKKECLELLNVLEPNELRGEYEMGDWIKLICDKYSKVGVYDLADEYMNINYPNDIQSAENLLK